MILNIILACVAIIAVGLLFGYVIWEADQEVQREIQWERERFGGQEIRNGAEEA